MKRVTMKFWRRITFEFKPGETARLRALGPTENLGEPLYRYRPGLPFCQKCRCGDSPRDAARHADSITWGRAANVRTTTIAPAR